MSSRLDFVTSVGHFLVGLGLNDLAERYFRHALTLVPDRRSTQALLLLDYMATTFALRQLDREAIELWREVVGTSPREDDLETSTIFVSALLGKGRAHGRLGERRQALRAFHDGLAAIGPHSSLLELKGKLQHEVAFRHHSDGQYSEAVAMFRLALATKNSVPNIDRHSLLSTRMMLGLALNQAEQQDDAASVLESVVRSPPGSEVDDLRLIAISALATAKHGRGDNAAALRLISAGKMITPTNDRGRQQLLGLELLEIKAGTAGATQRGLLRSLINRIDQAGRPHYAIPIYVQAQMGLLETYLDEGDQEGARRHLDAVLPIIPEIERERVEPVETLEIFKKFGQQVHDPSAPLSGLFKANRFRRAFSDDPPLIFGTWLPQELQNDFSVADHMFSQSLTRLAAELPHFPPIEFHFLHNDADTRASIKLYKDRFLVGIRSGAIRRIGDTLDAIVRSPEILSRWKLDFVLTGRVLVIDEGEVFMLDGKRLDPLRKDIRQTLLMISLDYLFCHELAHALNGHLGLIKKDGVSNLVRHTLEMNADAFAIGQTLTHALRLVRSSESSQSPGALFPSATGAVHTWMLAVYAYLRCLGPMEAVTGDPFSSSTHPPRAYRYLLNANMVDAQVANLGIDGAPPGLLSLSHVAREVEGAIGQDMSLDHCDLASAYIGFPDYVDRLLKTYDQIYLDLQGGAYIPLIKPSNRSLSNK